MKPPQVCDRIDTLDCSTVKENSVHLFGAAVSSLSALINVNDIHIWEGWNSLDYMGLGPGLSPLTTRVRAIVGRAGNKRNSLLCIVVSLRYRMAQWVPAQLNVKIKYLTNRPMFIPCARIFVNSPTLYYIWHSLIPRLSPVWSWNETIRNKSRCSWVWGYKNIMLNKKLKPM